MITVTEKWTVNYYYSDVHTQDTEGNLVMLCYECWKELIDEDPDMMPAGNGDTECQCEGWDCTANNFDGPNF